MKTRLIVDELLVWMMNSPDQKLVALLRRAAGAIVRSHIPAEDDPRQKTLSFVMRQLEDDMETSDLCVGMVKTMITAMNWSPETERLVIEGMKPVAEEMRKIAVEFKEIMGCDDPED
jgi:hypothetical protein